ncbi:acyl carrier protein [Streptomyces sp. NBC_01754]|uniref:acyl carrier protein n=1 Tax=Streptomyces sp. NBC_01754 TaxID=2975930 RepID=UPI002DD7F092|nr:acyl carrier protein [Streptomyces sp. NBC_01754]WSC91246.1 acyl carrier protein [Streptomyces sp. NBC_01754]
MPETYDTLRSVLTSSLRVPDDVIHPGATLEQLGLDSLALTELVLILHERFAVRISKEYARPGRTVTEVAEHLDALRAGGTRTAAPS